jgi:hypothetical protein
VLQRLGVLHGDHGQAMPHPAGGMMPFGPPLIEAAGAVAGALQRVVLPPAAHLMPLDLLLIEPAGALAGARVPFVAGQAPPPAGAVTPSQQQQVMVSMIFSSFVGAPASCMRHQVTRCASSAANDTAAGEDIIRDR